MGPFLFATLIAMVFTGFVSIFLPFNHTFDLVYAIIGTLLFSGYIVYDTYMINKRLSPDEYIMGAISLYLEYVVIFYQLHRALTSLLAVSSTFVRCAHPGRDFSNIFKVLNILRLLNNMQER